MPSLLTPRAAIPSARDGESRWAVAKSNLQQKTKLRTKLKYLRRGGGESAQCSDLSLGGRVRAKKFSPRRRLQATSFSFFQQWLPLFNRSWLNHSIERCLWNLVVKKKMAGLELLATEVVVGLNLLEHPSPDFKSKLGSIIVEDLKTWQQRRYFLCQLQPFVDWSSWQLRVNLRAWG